MRVCAPQGAKVGIFCTTPAVELSRVVSTKLAMEMLLTGEPITAEQAQQAGLVNRVVDEPSQLDAEVRARRLVGVCSISIRLIRVAGGPR